MSSNKNNKRNINCSKDKNFNKVNCLDIKKILTYFDNNKGVFGEIKNLSQDKDLSFLCQKINLSSRSFLEEIGKLKREIEDLKEKNKETEDKQRFSDETKIDFLSIVSHQLRTPLTVSSLQIEMILTGYKGELSPELNESLKDLYHYHRRMTEMLNIFSIISKIEMDTFTIKPKKLDIRIILDEVIAQNDVNIKEKKLKILRKYDEKVSEINIDEDLIQIVFSNLLINAINNSLNNGLITLTIKIEELGIFISFKNKGPAIPPEIIPKVFTKTYFNNRSIRQDLGDTGLGLYITKKIIDKCGGNIWFESSDKKGTAFHIFLLHNLSHSK